MKVRFACTLAVTIVSMESAAFAHHSFAAEFDATKPITLVGMVNKVEWRNPHAYFYVDVKDDQGNVTTWACELGSPNALIRAGWSRDAALHETVSVNGYLAKDGSKMINARTVTLPDGRNLFAGSAGPGEPAK